MFEQTFKNVDDVLWKEAGCTTELDYTEQTSWLLFLKYLDDLEARRAMEADLRGQPYMPNTAGAAGQPRRGPTARSTTTAR
jgi:type I restriction enzyme M protein